jgi:hypothetical protein
MGQAEESVKIVIFNVLSINIILQCHILNINYRRPEGIREERTTRQRLPLWLHAQIVVQQLNIIMFAPNVVITEAVWLSKKLRQLKLSIS